MSVCQNRSKNHYYHSQEVWPILGQYSPILLLCSLQLLFSNSGSLLWTFLDRFNDYSGGRLWLFFYWTAWVFFIATPHLVVFCGGVVGWDAHVDALQGVLLLVLEALVDLLKDLMLDLAGEPVLFGRFRDGAWWQVQVDLVNHLAQVALHVRHNDGLGELLAVRLVAPVVLDLDVQVERALAPVHLLAVLVGANVLPVDLLGRSSVMLFPVAALQMF